MNVLRSFRRADFCLLWIARTVSRVGDGINLIAVAWLVLETTGSATAMGVVLAAQLVPQLLFLLIGGIVVDRAPKLVIMLTSDLLRMCIVAGLALMTAVGRISIEWIVGYAVLFGLLDAFFNPAYSSVLPELVAADELPSANALSVIGGRLAGIAGPILGAALVATSGSAGAFAIDALSFMTAALLLLLPTVRGKTRFRPSTNHDRGSGSSILGDMRDGLRTVLGTPWIGITTVVAGVTNITLAGPIESVLPLLVARHFGGGVDMLGGIASLSALGALCAAGLLGRKARLRHRARLIYGPWIALAIAAAALGMPIGPLGAAAAAIIIGGGETALGLAWINALQEHVPHDRLGRVTSIDALGSYALIPVGYLVAGVASDAFGPAVVFVVGGSFSAAVLALAYALPGVRELD